MGFGLAKLEEPTEVQANNDILANRATLETSRRFHGNVTKELPRICLGILATSSTETMNATLEKAMDDIFVRVLDRTTDNEPSYNETLLENLPKNSTLELLQFMEECGATGLDIANRFFSLVVLQEYIGDDLSFNWIRCDTLGTNSTTSLLQQIWGLPYVNRSRLKPDVQAADAILSWRQNAAILYDETLDMLIAENGTSPIDARIEAHKYATKTANGFKHCYANSAAGAWFWFTVMTTIGYGNTAPTSEGGRAMIYTLGFFSILLFAVILGGAGKIVVAIWDDFVNRTKLHHLNIPWVGCIFWGFCYYAWMLVIAAVTQAWKAARLDEEMDFSEAYWFSYISTTTVGLGDNYLEHDVILRQDLFTFPLLFLTGFVLLANFFVKLTEVLTNLVPRNKPTLAAILAESNIPCLPKVAYDAVQKPLKALNSIAHSTSREKIDDDNAQVKTAVLEAGNETAASHSLAETIPMEAGDGWKGTLTGVATDSTESSP